MKTRNNLMTLVATIAMIFTVATAKAEGYKYNASGHETIEEASLEMESWMTDESVWNTNSFYFEEAESTLELENWMTNENLWSQENNNDTVEEESDQSLVLESWMTNDQVWNL